MKENVLRIRNLYKSFGDLDVLKGVDLDLNQSENLVVLGKSGTGKSVLIKIISGLITADSGEVNVLGFDMNTITKEDLIFLRLKVGFCFQNSALYDSMTIGENIEFPLKYALKTISRQEIEKRTDRVLEAVGLRQTKNQMPAELSGGQRKRIGIARTIVMNPELILYDEPTAGLDPITCVEINNLILEVKEEYQASSIIITHDLTCAKQTGDRVALLLEGSFQKEGTFSEVFNSHAENKVKQFYDYNFMEQETIKI
ncbi:ABC transporter ATP-binding protein [Jiulongibacter sediminis]|uniref:Organic solvent ABC transporter ATP-binding protein n=1 Tax=Jiulongibacter sediminis TaxID=1605367 RepID=A0A0P7C2K5_9BACT|nr:ATP-binding cassette domain-containing protein [Jiulongibacter sediminis]KPM48295.1 organic solvent ABC transporter ATP-binding protein [Jiulongibacter sediminis]TBX24834.1 organic solvent ABC transporter ATP-binding protein [Jiulongibacter sediminis]